MTSILRFLKLTRRLSSIERCSNTPHIKNSNVAEHSFYTALLAMLFADLENDRIMTETMRDHNIEVDSELFLELFKEPEIRNKMYDTSEVIKRALLHDLEESITGDILYPLKNENKTMKPLLKSIISKIVNDELFEDIPAERVRNYYVGLWRKSKDETKEGRLVAAADKFEILLYAISEIELGNMGFYAIYNKALSILHKEFSDIECIHDIVNWMYENPIAGVKSIRGGKLVKEEYVQTA